MEVLGFDLGFGHTKVVWDEGKLKFPTWIAYKTNAALSDVETVKVGTEEYVVGRDAAREPRRIEVGSMDILISLSPYFLKYALQKTEKDHPLVVTGVPPAYKDKREEFQKVLEDALGVRAVVVLQGMGILSDVEEKLGEEALVLDIGYNTVDYLFVEREGDGWRYVKGDTIADFGILRAVEAFREKIPSELAYVKNFPLSRISEVFVKGYLTLQGEKKHLGDVKELAIREYTKALLSRLQREIGNLIFEAETVVLGGGGAHILDKSQLMHSNVLVPEEPEFAQARGYYKIGRYLDEG